MHTGPMFLIYNFFMVQFVAPFFYSIANIFNIERKSNKFNNIIAYALKFNIPIYSEKNARTCHRDIYRAYDKRVV